MVRIFLALILWQFFSPLFAQPSQAERDFWAMSCLPVKSHRYWNSQKLNEVFDVNFRLNPFFLTGDFNSNEQEDVAIFVRDKKSGKEGIVVIFDAKAHSQIGAGNPLGNGGDNFTWLGIWRAEKKNKYFSEYPPDQEYLYLEKPESASGAVFWLNGQFVWHQMGD